MLSPFSGLMMKAVCFSEMLVFTYKSTRGVKTQKTNIDIFTSLRTSNLMKKECWKKNNERKKNER
jgi:hypothetical protein